MMETGVSASMWAAGGVAMVTRYLATCAVRREPMEHDCHTPGQEPGTIEVV